MTSVPLFRKQTLNSNRSRLCGDVLLTRSIRRVWLIAPLFGIVVGVVLWLSFTGFNRYVTVPGQVIPSTGQVKVYSSRPATLFSLYVKQGDQVRRGQVLASAGNVQSLTQQETRESQLRGQLEEQSRVLKNRRAGIQTESAQQLESVVNRIQVMRTNRVSLQRQQRLLAQRVQLKREQLTDIQKLADQGFLALSQARTQRQQLLDLRLAQEQLIERRSVQRLELETQLQLQKEIPLRLHADLMDLRTRQLDLESRLTQLKGQERFVITAPRTGSITVLQAKPGDRISPSIPLLTILGQGEKHKVMLFVGSRAIGFLRQGQSVRLKYASFPYRQFGTYAGVISVIDRSIMTPSDLHGSMVLREPAYRVEVLPSEPSVLVYGERVTLTAGMALEADIRLESRPLWRWLFEPLLAYANS